MIRVALACALLVMPAMAGEPEAPVSKAGTAFMQRCLADVTEARIALLKKQAPDFAASLSEEELLAGARQKAVRACPCFLHIIGTSPMSEGATPEEKAAAVMVYLDALQAGEQVAMPPVLATVTKNCGERSSVLPRRWFGL